MPYTPYTATEVSRSYAYRSAWVSAACSVVILPLYLTGFDGIFYGWIFGGAVGGVLASVFTGRADDYFRSLCAVGHRWVMFALVAYMLAGWLVWTIDIAHPAGRGLLAKSSTDAPSVFFDGHLFAIGLAIIYHAGYGFQWARDHFGSKDE